MTLPARGQTSTMHRAGPSAGRATEGTKPRKIAVTFSQGEYEARARVLGIDLPSEEQVREALSECGVVFGVLDQAVLELANNAKAGEIVVAKGICPLQAVATTIEYFVVAAKDALSFTPAENDEESVDFREGRLDEYVSPGTVLARKHPGSAGKAGRTVRGAEVPAPQMPEPLLVAGKGTRLSPNKLEVVATIAGTALITAGRVEVVATLQVRSVDIHSGNLYHIGPVKVLGDVAPGFCVTATGDVEVGGIVEGATVVAGGNVVVKGGVRNRARIEALGNCTARFVDSLSEVKALRDIHVQVYAVKSVLESGGRIHVDGRIVGGTTRAAQEVEAGELGSKNAAETLVEVMAHPVAQEQVERWTTEIAEVETKLAAIAGKARALESQAASGRSNPELRKLLAQQVKMMLDLERLKVLKAISETPQPPKARVLAGVSYPGARLQIGGTAIVVDTPAKDRVYQAQEAEK